MELFGTMLFKNLLTLIPILLAYLVVFVIALIQWNKFPRPSLLVIIATGLSLVLTIAFPLIQTALIAQQQSGRIQAGELATLMSGLAFVSSLLRIVPLAILISAVYAGRQPPETES
ncbi:MAG: hypothetical protein JSS02_12665 [Planctomycetes bacterium]|nr:hypothetical protein [Planctomycetota bacterium]